MNDPDNGGRSSRSEAHVISLQNTIVLFAILLVVGIGLSSTGDIPVSIITGLVTAIATVVLTFWFYRVRDTVRSLQALLSELRDNRKRALDVKEFVLADIAALEKGKQRTDVPPKFGTTAFETATKNGMLLEVSAQTRSILEAHYREIELTNQNIEKLLMNRQGISLALTDSSEILKQTDNQILYKINLLTGDTVVVTEEDLAQAQSENVDAADDIGFNHAIEIVEKELDEYKFISKIIG